MDSQARIVEEEEEIDQESEADNCSLSWSSEKKFKKRFKWNREK